MKRITLLALHIWLMAGLAFAQDANLTENFETGLPSSAPSSETTATLASGNWRVKGVYGKSDNGSMRAAMSTDGYMITPPLNKPLQVSFNHRGSGNNKVLRVEKSTDNGASWSAIGTATVGSGSTYGSSNLGIGEQGTNNVLLRFYCTSATIYVDNVVITASTMGDEPTVQAGIAASEVTGTSMKINFTKGDGENRLLVYTKAEATDWTPEDGTAYTKLPKAVDEKVVAAYYGDEEYTIVDGLEAGETYHFAVFESNGSKDGINYLTSTAGRLQQATLQVPSISTKPSSIHFGEVKTGTSSTYSFTLSAKYLEPASGDITLTSSPDFKLSTTSAGAYAASLTIPYTAGTLASQTVYVEFLPTELRAYSHTLSIAGGSATAVIDLQGVGSDTDAKTYYIAPSGSDDNDGTYSSPWFNLQKAVDAAAAGDVIICRGGTYRPTMKKDGSKTTVRLSHSGEPGKRITIKNYADELPVFDFDDQPKKQSVRGILLDGNYWHIYGLHITRAGDNGIKLEGNHNIIERCIFSYNDDTGLQLGFGHKFSDSHPGIGNNDGSYCAYNYVIDCDSYLNCDSDNFGSDADGFACKMHNGRENWFIRCRAWDNSDDAWDLYETDYPVYLIDCWAWGSGRADLFGWVQSSGSFQGNGNGVKLGGNGTGGSSKGKHEVWNCVAFNCNKTGSVKGFDQNSHGDGVKVVNSLAFGCGYDFMFEKSSNNCEYYNNVCLGKIEIKEGAIDRNNAMLSTSDKAWKNVVERNFSAADYISLSEEDAKAPRGEDGSLPTRFAHLKDNSNLRGKAMSGLVAPLPQGIGEDDLFGSALKPRMANSDLGPFDSAESLASIYPTAQSDDKPMMSIYPNPAQTYATLHLPAEQDMCVHITVTDLQGRQVIDAGLHQLSGNANHDLPLEVENLASGVYLIRVAMAEGKEQLLKLIVSH